MLKIIKDYFKKQNDITAAYLFGSFAKGKENKHSDVDIAVLFSLGAKEPFTDRRIDIMNDLSKLLHKETDVIALNNVSPMLRFKVIQTGKCLYEKDRIENRRFNARSMVEYLDFLPIKNLLESSVINKLKKA